MNSFHALLRTDALTFANQAHMQLHGCHLDNDMYLRLLAFDLERIRSGDIRRYLCNLPPGFGKTFLMAVTLAAWTLGNNPSARILITSYGEEPVLIISKKIRALLQVPWFQVAFPKTRLAKGQQAAGDFATTAGGAVYARSIDGATTGLRCDTLICDDLVQIRDSGNLQHLEGVNVRFHPELVSRVNRPGTIVIVQHRLNRLDLTGYLLMRHQNYKHRMLPLIATEDRKYRLKNGIWHRKQGDVLRPSAYSPEDIAELREYTGAPGFGPLYQQSFDGPDVIQVRREDFVIERFYARPAVPYILSIDPNHKGANGQSFSVIQCWALLDDKYLLFDQWRGRAHKSVFAAHIRRMKAEYRPRVILIEDNGPALDLQEQFETSACPVILVTPSGDKVARLRRHLDLFRNGQIVLRAGLPFMEEFMAEFEAFPYGINDDQVDTATQVFDYVESNGLPPPSNPPVVGARGNPRKARAMLYWNGGRPSGPYVFSRR